MDLTEIMIGEPKEVFDEIVFFARLVAEHARRHGRNLPKLIIVPPRNHPSTMDRMAQLRDEAGLNIEVAATLEGAKAAFLPDIDWHILRAIPQLVRDS